MRQEAARARPGAVAEHTLPASPADADSAHAESDWARAGSRSARAAGSGPTRPGPAPSAGDQSGPMDPPHPPHPPKSSGVRSSASQMSSTWSHTCAQPARARGRARGSRGEALRAQCFASLIEPAPGPALAPKSSPSCAPEEEHGSRDAALHAPKKSRADAAGGRVERTQDEAVCATRRAHAEPKRSPARPMPPGRGSRGRAANHETRSRGGQREQGVGGKPREARSRPPPPPPPPPPAPGPAARLRRGGAWSLPPLALPL